MFDFLLFVVAAAVQTSAGSNADAPAPSAVPEAEATAQAESSPAVPVFLAPESKLTAEPQVPTGKFTTAVEIKPILGATRGNWIAVREYGGQDVLYVTHLWSWRCGLVQMKIGLNGAAPEVWDMPPCHEDQPAPNMIGETDGLPYRSFVLGSIEKIDVELTYDDLSVESHSYDRAGVLMP